MYKAWWLGNDGIPWQSVVSVRCKKPNGTQRPKSMVVTGVNDLKTLRPDLASEWNYEKNTEISINDVMPGSKNRVWWKCIKGHEWEATIQSRNRGRGCAFCNQEHSTSFPEQALFYYVRKLFPDAKNRYYPEPRLEIDIFIPSVNIGIEYDGGYYHSSDKKKTLDQKKNDRLKELDITLIRIVEEGGNPPDNTEYIIICPRKNSAALIDVAISELFELLNSILNKRYEPDIDSERDRSSIMEQYILSEKENSLARIAPQVIDEWHPIKNGAIRPEYVHAMSNKLFWWKCKVCGYEWKTRAYRRARGMGCPACTGNIVAEGINDLPTTHPALMNEWSFQRNDEIDPHKCIAGTNKKAWWHCQKCGYEWQTAIVNRTRGNGCPQCAGKIVNAENSLAAVYPKIAAEWAYDLNSGARPEFFMPGSEKRAWWRCEKGHIWSATIVGRTKNNGCPYCGNKQVLTGYNDFATLYPDMLCEWDYEKNTIAPEKLIAGSNKKVYWICNRGHRWEAKLSNRIRGNNCPYCNNRLIAKGENDLKHLYPELSAEWDYEKNEDEPTEYTPGSNKKVYWKCRKCGNGWPAIINARVKGRGCPYCAGVRPIPGINDLETMRPELADEWNYDRNLDGFPNQFMPNSRAVIWWRCKSCGYEWQASIGERSRGRRGCPNCKQIKRQG